jgi:hypothetical protein
MKGMRADGRTRNIAHIDEKRGHPRGAGGRFQFWKSPPQQSGGGNYHLSGVMPALVAGIHVFLTDFSAGKTWMAGTSLDKPGHDFE